MLKSFFSLTFRLDMHVAMVVAKILTAVQLENRHWAQGVLQHTPNIPRVLMAAESQRSNCKCTSPSPIGFLNWFLSWLSTTLISAESSGLVECRVFLGLGTLLQFLLKQDKGPSEPGPRSHLLALLLLVSISPDKVVRLQQESLQRTLEQLQRRRWFLF